MIAKTKGATFTLYFANGETYTKDYTSKFMAECAGKKLAQDHGLVFTHCEKIANCDHYYVA